MAQDVDGEIVVVELELDELAVHGVDMMVDAWVEYFGDMVYGMHVPYGMDVM